MKAGWIVAVGCAVILQGLGAAPSHAQVEGRIRRVGLFAESSPLVRNGDWSFVEVELRWRGDKPLDGLLQVDQLDADGDVVTYSLEAPLTPDGQWHQYEVYFAPHDVANNNTVKVRLLDDRRQLVNLGDQRPGQTAGELVSDPILDLSSDELLIVDLTTPKKLPHARWLDSGDVGKAGWVNARQVRGMSPRELPRRWQGLQAVDAIIWDDADPSGLSPQQIAALVEWVEAGGRLLVTAGKNWQSLAGSSLAEALPVSITGVRSVKQATAFARMVKNEAYEAELRRLYRKNPVGCCQVSPLPVAVPIPADGQDLPLVYRWQLGRGLVVFVAASLRELLPPPDRISLADEQQSRADLRQLSDDPFVRACEEVVGQKLLALGMVQPRADGLPGVGWAADDLFGYVRHSVGFEALGAAFLIFAVLFAVGYTFIAAVGSYWYLKRRSWQHRSWLAFAVSSVAGTVIGTGMVWMLRGVTTDVWQTTIIDGQSGIDYGHAVCLFGVKTPSHARINLRLPVGSKDDPAGSRAGVLRAMPEESDVLATESTYAASERYECDVLRSLLVDVPVRATLKEFTGHWRGPLNGALDAKLVARRTSDPAVRYEFAEGSYIRNNLGVNLRRCYLLETFDDTAVRAERVGCFYLGDLPKSGDGSALDAEQIRQRLFYEQSPTSPASPPSRIKKWPWLTERVGAWVAALPGGGWRVGDPAPATGRSVTELEDAPLLLASVFDLMDHRGIGRRSVRRSFGRSWSCTGLLTNRTAVLIGWSDEPPPARLEIDGKIYRPDRCRTLYRFTIPVERPKSSRSGGRTAKPSSGDRTDK